MCRALEIADTATALQRLDEDEKGTVSTRTPGGVQRLSAVNESGLYTLVLGSRKPEAKVFKRWITHEVLPSIRRAGAYSVPENFYPKGWSQIPPPVSPQDKVLELMEELMRARQENADLRVAAAQKEVEDLRLELEIAWAHDEKVDRKQEQSRERVRRFRERQKQARQSGEGLIPAE